MFIKQQLISRRKLDGGEYDEYSSGSNRAKQPIWNYESDNFLNSMRRSPITD